MIFETILTSLQYTFMFNLQLLLFKTAIKVSLNWPIKVSLSMEIALGALFHEEGLALHIPLCPGPSVIIMEYTPGVTQVNAISIITLLNGKRFSFQAVFFSQISFTLPLQRSPKSCDLHTLRQKELSGRQSIKQSILYIYNIYVPYTLQQNDSSACYARMSLDYSTKLPLLVRCRRRYRYRYCPNCNLWLCMYIDIDV